MANGEESPPLRSTEFVLFLAIGGLTLVIAVLYGLLSNDDTGKVLLLVTVLFSLTMAGFLFLRDRVGGVALESEEQPRLDARLWFPVSSLWPLGIAGGAALFTAGLALGPWVYWPGLALLARSTWGFVAQSRRRN